MPGRAEAEASPRVYALQAIEHCNVVVLMVDAAQEISDQDAHIAGFAIEAGRALVLAVNKWDAVDAYRRDHGKGIPKDRQSNIFEPFFSTKEGGTGLGLTVSYNIVSAHGGILELMPERGAGACFRIFLP